MDSRDLHVVNGAMLTLLPKTTATSCLKDYRLISLIHCLGRLVLKVLANRLEPRLAELIHSGQSAFIKGHFIQGNFNLVQSSAKLLHAKKFPCLLLKIDIARAFDSVASSFLLEVMKHMGFPYGWLNWIVVLLSSATTRVVMNGVLEEPISHGRGLCCVRGPRCPPPPPMLFLLIMEVLDSLIRKADSWKLHQDLGVSFIPFQTSFVTEPPQK
jgi:hypothetical protein